MKRTTISSPLAFLALAAVACGSSTTSQTTAGQGTSDAGDDAPVATSPEGGSEASTEGGGGSGGSGDSGTSGDAGGGEGGAGTCSSPTPGANTDFGGYRMFPADNPINMRVDSLPVNAMSAQWLQNCSASAPYLQLDLSMPYNVAPAGTPPVTGTQFAYDPMPYPNPWLIPAAAAIEGGDPTTPGDHHCLVFSKSDCKLYEVYNILWAADHKSFTAASGTIWDTTSNAPGNGSGSDAAGLPVTPLLIRYDELIEAGAIQHALRFTCAASEQGHIAPARASASSSAGSGIPSDPHDPTYPPMGMRVRLKASYDPTAHNFPPPIVAILVAIQKYGLILADNGGKGTQMFISGSNDMRLYNALINPAYLIKSVTASDLEVVDTGPVVQD